MPKLKEPSPKQLGWLKDYVETGNSSEAIRRNYNTSNSGSIRKMAFENTERLRKGEFNLEVAKLKESIADEDEVLEILSTQARTAKKSADKIRSCEILGKIHGLQKDKQEVQHSYKPDSQVSIDERYRKLLASKGHSEVPSSSN